jgi:hypothetical protein
VILGPANEEDEDEEPQADDLEIGWVLSKFLPSLAAENTTNTSSNVDVDAAVVESEPLDLRTRSSSKEGRKESFLCKVFSFVPRRVRRLVRSPVKRGHTRIEWICVRE